MIKQAIIGGTYVRKLGLLGPGRTPEGVRRFVADVEAVVSGFLPVFLAGRGSRNHQSNGSDEDRVEMHVDCLVL